MSGDALSDSNGGMEERKRNEQQVVKGIIDNFENEFYEGLHASRGAGNERANERDKDEDMKSLRHAWIKEKMVPDILPYEEGLIERILERIRHQAHAGDCGKRARKGTVSHSFLREAQITEDRPIRITHPGKRKPARKAQPR
ncbi:hypothetical protein PMKS-000682 [Pichia membranifaciens]|uniref:Uncharacterized protein n=1 Tax=Pichia membranifaciens TaxID=4926 RepID=A0A1Q2YCJ8_9ASCO|nr:hypothetical protein PMKS-000682 [Pichia membranifaciens]